MKRLFVFLMISMAITSLCYAQSSNDAQRILGTWANQDASITFNSNGTYTGSFLGDGNYFFSNNKLILYMTDYFSALIYNYYFSSDGRILVLEKGFTGNGHCFIKR